MKSRTIASIFITALLLLSAGTPAKAQTPTLKVGLASLSMFTIIWHVAQDKGFFEKEGVRVELNHFESGSINMKALLARAVDVSDVETGLLLGAAGNGADIRVIGTQSQRLHFALYTKNDIKTLKDLYGHTFGISGIGGLPHLVILALMERQGLDPDQLKMMAVGGTGARLTALAAGKIDATLGEFSPKIEAEPSLHRLMIISQELPQYMAQGIIVWADVLAAKRDAIERMQRAMVQASRWAYDNKAELIEVARKHLPASTEELSKVYDSYVLARVWAINGEVDPALLTYMQNLGMKTKTQSVAVDLNKLVSLDIYNSIVKSLGTREYPKR
jgi:NitT/TauT family transport system substrate-binding protein